MDVSPRFGEALAWASKLHARQMRKSKVGDRSVPYISHLLAVSALVWEDGGDEDEAIAALLHDAVEDQGVTTAQISRRFGDKVARIVMDCTDLVPDDPAAIRHWLPRKRAHIERVPGFADDSLRVLAADKAHNATVMVWDARDDSRSWDRFRGGLVGTAWYLVRMHALLEQRLPQSRSVAKLALALDEFLKRYSLSRETLLTREPSALELN